MNNNKYQILPDITENDAVCPQCEKPCRRVDIVSFGWCLLCEDQQGEVSDDEYMRKQARENT